MSFLFQNIAYTSFATVSVVCFFHVAILSLLRNIPHRLCKSVANLHSPYLANYFFKVKVKAHLLAFYLVVQSVPTCIHLIVDEQLPWLPGTLTINTLIAVDLRAIWNRVNVFLRSKNTYAEHVLPRSISCKNPRTMVYNKSRLVCH